MFILDSSDRITTSPKPASRELHAMDSTASSPHSGSKKRKRSGFETNGSFSSSLSALANIQPPNILTPAPSSSPSIFAEQNGNLPEVNSHITLPPAGITANLPAAKRVHLAARPLSQLLPHTPFTNLSLSATSSHHAHYNISSGIVGGAAANSRYFSPPPTASPPSSASATAAAAGYPQPGRSVTACHICHRRPSTTAHLDAYADCESCGQRTCSVCVRRCEGPRCRERAVRATAAAALQGRSGQSPFWLRRQGSQGSSQGGAHQQQQQDAGRLVCAACCVETGRDGRVWCLPCYDDDECEIDPRELKSKRQLQAESAGKVTEWLNRCCVGDEELGEDGMDIEVEH